MKARTHRTRRLPLTLFLAAAALAACDDSPTAPQATFEDPTPALSAATTAQDASTDRTREVDTHRPDLPGAGFGGLATLVGVRHDAPHRIARIEISRSTRGWLVDLHEGRTQFDPNGDLVRFGEVLEALEAGARLKIQGSGPVQDDGVIGAARAIVLFLEHDGGDAVVAKGLAALQSVRGESPNQVMNVLLTNPRTDQRIEVEILENSTQFVAGDLHTFGRLLDAFRADVRVWIAARGQRNDEGVLVATSVSVEIATGNDGRDRQRDHQTDRQNDRQTDRGL